MTPALSDIENARLVQLSQPKPGAELLAAELWQKAATAVVVFRRPGCSAITPLACTEGEEAGKGGSDGAAGGWESSCWRVRALTRSPAGCSPTCSSTLAHTLTATHTHSRAPPQSCAARRLSRSGSCTSSSRLRACVWWASCRRTSRARCMRRKQLPLPSADDSQHCAPQIEQFQAEFWPGELYFDTQKSFYKALGGGAMGGWRSVLVVVRRALRSLQPGLPHLRARSLTDDARRQAGEGQPALLPVAQRDLAQLLQSNADR